MKKQPGSAVKIEEAGWVPFAGAQGLQKKFSNLVSAKRFLDLGKSKAFSLKSAALFQLF